MNDLLSIRRKRAKILIVDDVVDNLKLLMGLLRDNYDIRVAKNGFKAIECLDANPDVDLILMDVVMPEMDGFTACQHIKEDPRYMDVPVIFLTALNEATDETQGLAVGGADFISKPYNASVVQARIQLHLELRQTRVKSDLLLKNLLPEPVIRQLKEAGTYVPEIHKHTSVMFCDLVGFTGITTQLEPRVLVAELTQLFAAFDEIVLAHGGMRIKTMGDGYMAAAGLGSNSHEHASTLVNSALDIIDYLARRNQNEIQSWRCRIGIHSGEVISGIVGQTRCQFDIMGDTVNIAARVENVAQPMVVTVTQATIDCLTADEYALKACGEAQLKGRGAMHLFQVRRTLGASSNDRLDNADSRASF